nr:MAG TPA: hypothetical protein [Caudoviricetes sp.]
MVVSNQSPTIITILQQFIIISGLYLQHLYHNTFSPLS